MQKGVLYYYDCSQRITKKETNTNLVVNELWIFYLAQKVKVWERGSKIVMHFSGHLLRRTFWRIVFAV